MENELKLIVEARWDLDCVPAGEASERGLLLRVVTPELKSSASAKKTLNLTLVIDASGSMRGARLHAAKQAAMGIIERLSDEDRVSIVSFSDDVYLHVNGECISPFNRGKIIHDIDLIETRGMTDLGGGWMAGADAAANILDEIYIKTGNVVILSDGMANRGLMDPLELGRHSTELLMRGISTSCVGIGDNYSPIQLDAIAEAGGGRLHDCATADEIIEVLLGELGAIRETVASSVEIELDYATGTTTQMLTRLPFRDEGNHIKARLGTLGSADKRDSAFLVEVPSCPAGEKFRFRYRVRWEDPETGERFELPWATTFLTVVDPLHYQERFSDRDEATARQIILLWRSSLVYESVRLNDAGQFHEAGNVIDNDLQRLSRFVTGMTNGDELLRKMSRLYETVRRPWHNERAKRDSFTSSKKMMKSEVDYRSHVSEAWQDLESWRPDNGKSQSGKLQN